ncbi:hypothetical protein Hypma_002931 [Hypsizygus marmoreus]|uniref:Uncharacterized protein n=1 Tax=Hypsizygus marmoreus TaxID=39966 RepID=A0A369JCG5_HYPMA|nr:hypothetical protein Hypma_002931 [Hypsizygus marmoreus]
MCLDSQTKAHFLSDGSHTHGTSFFYAQASQMNSDTEESRFRHLLSGNHEPQSREIEEVRNIVKRRESILKQTDAQLLELLKTAMSLWERRVRDDSLLSRFHCILSPMRRLPRELLIEIFLLTRDWLSEEGGFTPIPVGPYSKPSPLVITHVCSDWRKVALSMPALWATIRSSHEKYDPSVPDSGPLYDERLQTWLIRTGKHHPLDITFEGPPTYHETPCPVSWINPYMNRVRTLTLVGGVGTLPSGTFPMLEMLSIDDYDSHDELKNNQVSFPSIHRVVLKGCFYHDPSTFVPLLQLTHLYLDIDSTFPMSIFLDMVSQAKELVELELSFFEVDEDLEDPDLIVTAEDRVVMGQLQTLVTPIPVVTSSLLRYVTLPALITLDLTYNLWPASLYSSLQSRSSFPLQSLNLRNWICDGMDPTEFLDVLQKLPSLREIVSYGALAITPTLVSGLTSISSDGVPDVAPNLEYLGLFVNPKVETDDGLLLEMVASRDPSGKPAVLEPTPQPGMRVFRSHLPKQLSSYKLLDFAMDKLEPGVHICF